MAKERPGRGLRPPAPLALLTALAVLALAAQPAAAHSAPEPRPQDTRLLHDHNDDCGGDAVLTHCRGSLDLIALDAQETAADGTHRLVFRFTLARGGEGTQGLTLRFDTPAGPVRLDANTTDHATFTGSFDELRPAAPTGDGTRFVLEGVVAADRLGLVPGDEIGGFRVEARRDGVLGDFMPGGYEGADGPVADPDQGAEPTNYARPGYALRGASYYVALGGPHMEERDGAMVLSWEVRNLLAAPQTVSFAVAPADVARVADDDATLRLPSRGRAYVEASFEGEVGDRVRLVATTDLGGRTEHEGPVMASALPSLDPTTEAPDATSETPGASAAAVLLALALPALAALARRRRLG